MVSYQLFYGKKQTFKTLEKHLKYTLASSPFVYNRGRGFLFCYLCKMDFKSLQLNKQLLNAIADQGYEHPTPIQTKVIPHGLNGHDIIGIAQTGTGKTAAFLLPVLMKVKYAQGEDARVLILEPTRELAIQVEEECEKFCKYTDIRYTAIYGGIGPKTQIEVIEKGIDIIIATPGRFWDLYKKGTISTKHLKYFIIDEADRMMDMGFMPQLNQILEVVPRKRQNMLFSATMPERVKKLSEDFLEFPIEVEVTPQSTPAETVEQFIYHLPNLRTKIEMLSYLLKDEKNLSKVIVFTKTKKNADDIFKFIERKVEGTVRVIHANKGQNSRINAINAFKEGSVRVLVSTDVTARGIDVTEVSHVINFDVPGNYEDYVHRIGRTGRAFKTGTAISFVNPAEQYHIKNIEKIIQMKIGVKDTPESLEIFDTNKEESIAIAREIDYWKRKEDPSFQGAFHDPKPKSEKKKKKRK